MVAGVWADDGILQLEATAQFRKLLSIGDYWALSYKLCNNYTCFMV